MSDDSRRTDNECVEPDCHEKAGTRWSPYWCPAHDEERRTRITAALDALDAGEDR